MNIVELARQAGLQLLLDGRIGTETYQSISGSLCALQRFADAVSAATREASLAPSPEKRNTSQPVRRGTPARARRARRRLTLRCRHGAARGLAALPRAHRSV